MSIYETPLQFGYFLALLFAALLGYRGWQEERLSDKLLGVVMFLLAMEIQDYTFGFSGINYLWEKLDGFPRYFTLAFAPTIYFYLRAQINRNFQFKVIHLVHYLPYFTYFLISIVVFLQGKEAIRSFRASSISGWLGWLEKIAVWASYIYYFSQSLRIYRDYRRWAETQFSDTETVSFIWLRNFIYLIIAGEVFKLGWNVADMLLGDLPFEQDWWWHLLTIAIICYVGIKGYAQIQPNRLNFSKQAAKNEEPEAVILTDKTERIAALPTDVNYAEWKAKIDRLMNEEKIYLEPELTLSDLANRLKTNVSALSGVINGGYGKNFNDFVNEFRVEEFKKQRQNPKNQHLSLLGIALDCGFNSKATFNRAVKKFTGASPRSYDGSAES